MGAVYPNCRETAKSDMAQEEAHCPLVAVDRRLTDAHRLWHQAENAYFQPDEFRMYAQMTVQTLRTVTWLLQAQKRLF